MLYFGWEGEKYMGRENILEDRVTLVIVLEREQLKKLDKVAGLGNRSAYMRWLVDTIDERHIKRQLQLEGENKMLKRLPAELTKVIKKKESKIQILKLRIKALKEGRSMGFKELPGINEIIYQYVKWKYGLELRGIIVGGGKELDWIGIRAKEMDVDPRELLNYIHNELETTVKNQQILPGAEK